MFFYFFDNPHKSLHDKVKFIDVDTPEALVASFCTGSFAPFQKKFFFRGEGNGESLTPSLLRNDNYSRFCCVKQSWARKISVLLLLRPFRYHSGIGKAFLWHMTWRWSSMPWRGMNPEGFPCGPSARNWAYHDISNYLYEINIPRSFFAPLLSLLDAMGYNSQSLFPNYADIASHVCPKLTR